MTDDGPRNFFVGGMDAGIEELLLDAGGTLLVPHASADPAGPWIGLAFAPARRKPAEVALRVCRDHGWLVVEGIADGSVTTLSVQEVIAVRLLRRLTREEASPDTVVVRNSDLTPAQVRGIHEALPIGTRLHIAER